MCLSIRDMLSDILQKFTQEWQTLIFTSGETLVKHIRDKEQFDVIFLDIELPKINGIGVGKKIREEMGDEITKIIYISSNTNYALELFEIRPFNFLVKPIEQERLENVINKAWQLIKEGNLYFNYQYQHISCQIKIKDIIFFNSKGRKITIHLVNDCTKEFNGKLEELAKELEEKGFLSIHKSFLVNKAHVANYSYDTMKMSNDIILNISQAKRKAVRHSFMLLQAGR